MKVKAGDLAGALKPVKPHPLKRKFKAVPVSLEQDFVTGALSVIEAKHGTFAKSIATAGQFAGPVQVDGVLLQRLAASWPESAELELGADAEALMIRCGKSITRVARLDGGGANPIIRKPKGPDKRHTGKVEVPPDPIVKRVELADTWGFSARVPMPQHRDKDETG